VAGQPIEFINREVTLKGSDGPKYKSAHFKESEREGGDGKMQKILTTTYSENLPSPNYKTRHFTRSLQETLELPDGEEGKKVFLENAERQQKICETLVKNDINRHIEMMEKAE